MSLRLQIRRGNRDNPEIFFVILNNNIHCGPSLTQLYSERPKLYGVLAVLSAIGLKFLNEMVLMRVTMHVCMENYPKIIPFTPS